MTLLDVISVTDENIKVFVCGLDGDVLPEGIYDGKNGVDTKYNDATVEHITTENNALIITINW